MKGLFLSVSLFILYVLSTVLLARIARAKRHSKLFIPCLIVVIFFYLAGYSFTPPGLWFIPARWQAHFGCLDLALGLLLLILNIHSYVDWFFAFNGGFSTSLILLLRRYGQSGATAAELIANYHGRDGANKIHGWRLPRLEETGYLKIDCATRVCKLTRKGRIVASLTKFGKEVLNLGAGG